MNYHEVDTVLSTQNAENTNLPTGLVMSLVTSKTPQQCLPYPRPTEGKQTGTIKGGALSLSGGAPVHMVYLITPQLHHTRTITEVSELIIPNVSNIYCEIYGVWFPRAGFIRLHHKSHLSSLAPPLLPLSPGTLYTKCLVPSSDIWLLRENDTTLLNLRSRIYLPHIWRKFQPCVSRVVVFTSQSVTFTKHTDNHHKDSLNRLWTVQTQYIKTWSKVMILWSHTRITFLSEDLKTSGRKIKSNLPPWVYPPSLWLFFHTFLHSR